MDEPNLESMTTLELFDRYVVANYRRMPLTLVRGSGSQVWDDTQREYLDFFPGWGCNLLGHCHPKIVSAVQGAVEQLIHVPNTWHTRQQGIWAGKLVQRAFPGKVFFCNSGAEANEAAIKLARLHCGPQRYKIITFTGGFHGRTLGALAATAQPKYHEGLGPMVAGFQYCPFNDLDAVAQRIDDETAAILLEPIQGEGGIRIADRDFLIGLRQLCDRHDLLLMLDEVQSGCGRTGDWFAFRTFGVQPDVVTLAKSLCGGLAGGAMIARDSIAGSLRPGMHASTFGGNPISAAAGIAFLEAIEEEGLLDACRANAQLFGELLEPLAEQCDLVREVRQVGLMIGIELECDGNPIVAECLRNGLLINCVQQNVLRLLPAMTLRRDQIERGMEILRTSIERAQASAESHLQGA
jgi:predicted acetylornithine/succinylornithine family transaminase